MRVKAFLCSLVLLAGSRLAAEQWMVAGATNATAANGLHYATDLKLYNQGTASASVALDLITEPGTAPAGSVPQSIAPGQTLVLSNVLQSVWGLKESSGALRIQADQQLVIAANAYTDADPAAVYGYDLQAIPYEQWTTAGATVHSAWVSQSAAFSSAIGLVLAAPNTAVDVRVFDATGKQVARMQFSGGPLAQRIPLSSLVSGDLPAGRVECYVVSGRALAYALVTDTLTGDTMAVPGQPDTTQPLDAALNGMVRGRSALRIFNVSVSQAASIRVTVQSASVGELIGKTATLNLTAGQMQEIPDVLGQLFQAPDGATAALRMQSTQPVIVLARTVSASKDGITGSFGALIRPVALADFLSSTSAATITGLRQDTGDTGTESRLSLLAGADGASAQLLLSDPAGAALGSTTVALGPWAAQETSLADLFTGDIPDDSRLDVQMTAGELSAFARATDLSTGDTWIIAAAPQQTYACPAPAIVSFSAAPNALTASGRTTLYWSTANADSVAISPGVTTPALSGTATVSLTASTSFSMTATGPCGTASQKLTVSVGAPTVTSVSSLSGMPGQLLTLKPANIADPAAIQGIAVSIKSLKLAVRIESVTPSGDLNFRVPFVADAADPAGHLTGTASFAIDSPSGRATGTFTILPLRYTGDAVADFRSLTSAVIQYVKSELNAEQSVPQFAAAIPALSPLADQIAAVLNQAASDIAAKGSATVPLTVPGGRTPPSTVTIARKDLEQFLALYSQITGAAPGSLPARTSLASAHRLRAADSGAGLCLTESLPGYYRVCLSHADSDPFQGFQQVVLQLVQQSSMGQCTFNSPTATAFALGSYLAKALRLPEILCQLDPVQINSFTAEPLPDPIPVGERNQGTRIVANLGPLLGPPYNASDIATAPWGEALLALQNLPDSCASQVRPAVNAAFIKSLDELTSVIQSVLDSWSSQIDKPLSMPVYKCDLNDVQALDPLRLARRPDWDDDGALRFGFQGLHAGLVPLEVVTKDKHFLRQGAVTRKQTFRYRYLEQDPDAAAIRRTSVTVTGGKKVVVNSSQQNIGPVDPRNRVLLSQTVVQGAPFRVPLATGEPFPGQPGYEVHSVQQVNDNTWLIQISVGGNSQGGVEVSFTNPQNRNGTQRVIVNANGTGKDCGMYFTANARGADGKQTGPSYDVLHGDLTQYTMDAPGGVNGRVFLELDGVSGGSCQGFGTIQLLDQ